MKNLFFYITIGFLIVSCGSTSKTTVKNDTNLPEGAVRIANDSLEYEIIIFDIGYETYLKTIAKPEWYYSQEFLEIKNKFYVTEWNIRVNNPFKYNPDIYENRIDYDFNTNYGLEVNYKLYNYFKFVEYKYKEVF
ncbi:hypothetical protein SAMN06265371_10941 [Lutibacter agarilyticus]|uniref:Lipoprotein n=1 Tax=Lutibacter agarilyticus TaxID=1109740 RepID=A0A238YGE0_9FLAO|nr:DUF6146 family protein [Lutibacter agarilyticus]SNR70042.1 hypothetical protein SAMN06265371_10941 [Lutibacter agarilyticus]